MSVKKLTLLAIFTAVASIINILESYVQIIPGIPFKIGFSNIITLIIIYKYGTKEAIITVMLRIIVTALYSPGTFNYATFSLSLSGAIFSLIALSILVKLNFFGITANSTLSSLFHVIGQLVAASFLFTDVVAYYAPLMLFISIPAGVLTGILADRFIESTKDLFIDKKF